MGLELPDWLDKPPNGSWEARSDDPLVRWERLIAMLENSTSAQGITGPGGHELTRSAIDRMALQLVAEVRRQRELLRRKAEQP